MSDDARVTHARVTDTHVTEVYYDGACPICSREIATYRTCRGADAVAFVDIRAVAGPHVAPDLTREDALARFHVRRADGALVAGGAAFAAVWSTLPALRPLARLARTRAGSWAVDRGYRVALRLLPYLRRLAGARAAPTVARCDEGWIRDV